MQKRCEKNVNQNHYNCMCQCVRAFLGQQMQKEKKMPHLLFKASTFLNKATQPSLPYEDSPLSLFVAAEARGLQTTITSTRHTRTAARRQP